MITLDRLQNYGRVERLGSIVSGSPQTEEFSSLRNDTVLISHVEKDLVERGLRFPSSKGKKNPKDETLSSITKSIEGYLLTECLSIIDSHGTKGTRKRYTDTRTYSDSRENTTLDF